MKKFLKLILFIIIIYSIIYYKDSITEFIYNKFIYSIDPNIENNNNYSVDYNFLYVKKTTDFYAKDKKDLMNILFTGINNGSDNFYFFCIYDECEDDINEITNHQINNLNNFVHPYNSFKKLNVTIDNLGKIEVNVTKVYTNEEIIKIDKEINKIYNKIINNNMSSKDKITKFHNYIIDNTKYDKEYIDNNIIDIDSPSHNAIGVLFNGKALCSGYTDVMAIFLNKLKIPNYRISSENHIWNFVFLDNYYHIDLTWDDPVNDNSDIRLNTFNLITTKELESLNVDSHNYDKNIFLEAK